MNPEGKQSSGCSHEADPESGSGAEYSHCQEAVQRLTEFLAHELKPEEEAQVNRHLQECGGCFAKFHFEETLLRTIRERIESVHAPGSLRSKILGIIARPPEGSSSESP